MTKNRSQIMKPDGQQSTFHAASTNTQRNENVTVSNKSESHVIMNCTTSCACELQRWARIKRHSSGTNRNKPDHPDKLIGMSLIISEPEETMVAIMVNAGYASYSQ